MTVNPERNRKVKERFKNHWKDYQQSTKEHTESYKSTHMSQVNGSQKNFKIKIEK